MSLNYEELLGLPAYAEAAYMPCVEGWGFDAKWTGFRVEDLLNLSGLKSDSTYIVFHSQDGYSTGLSPLCPAASAIFLIPHRHGHPP